MRCGLCAANFGTYADPRTLVELAEEAEAAGWEALLIWDHHSFVWGPPAADPWVTLAAVAARTERLLLGTNVTPVPRRRPHVLAHQVATLDVLAGGRVVFAAGIGGVESEFEKFGEPGDARVRAEMLDEGLEVLRALWSGEEVNHRGGHYMVDGVTLAPARRIPIWIGGNSPRALRRAARYDGWAADTESPEGMRLSPEDLARSIEAIGRGDGFEVAIIAQREWADPAAYAEAGTTWWLESIHDMRASPDELREVVRAGPPAAD